MLQRLRGKINYIYTGVALIDVATSRTQVSVMTAEVKMRDYSDEEIRAYIKT
jgi:septum formation protein